jgi:hypothetical protein
MSGDVLANLVAFAQPPFIGLFPARLQRLNVGTPEPQKHAAAHARNRPDRVR